MSHASAPVPEHERSPRGQPLQPAAQALDTHYRATRDLLESPDLVEGMNRLLRTVGEGLGAAVALLWLVEPRHEQGIPAAMWGAGDGVELVEVVGLRASVELRRLAWRTGSPCRLVDLGGDDERPAGRAGIADALAVPVIGGAEILGVIELWFGERQSGRPGETDGVEALGWLLGHFIVHEQTREALDESHSFFEQITNNIPGVLWLADQRTPEMIYVSPGYEVVWGRSRESLYANPRSFLEAIHPDDRPRAFSSLERQLAGEVTDEEYRVIRPDGTLRWIWDRGIPIKGRDGEVYRIAGIAQDITRRKASEEAQRFLSQAGAVLMNSLDYSEMLTRIARLAIPFLADYCFFAVWEAPDRFRFVSAHVDPAKEALIAAYQQQTAFDPLSDPTVATVLRTGQALLVPEIPEERLRDERYDAELQALVEALHPRSVILTPLTTRGETMGLLIFNLSERNRRYTDDDLELALEVARRAALAIENSRLYTAEQEARQATEAALDRVSRLQAVTAALSPAVTAEEAATVVVHESIAALGATMGMVAVLLEDGVTFETLYQQGWSADVTDERSRVSLHDPLPIAEAVRSGRGMFLTSSREVAARYPDLSGARRAEAHVYLPLMIEGRTLGAIGLGFGEPRAFTNEDKKFLYTLAQQCGQAIERARLYDQERAARAQTQEALALRDAFFSMASHELKTPLTALQGYTELLYRRVLREGGSDRDQRAVKAILNQAQRMRRLIEMMLDLSRLQAGQLKLERGPVDLADLARNLVEEWQPVLDRHGIEFAAPKEPVMVDGDALRLDQVLQNLIDNAVKYSPDGGRVAVSVEAAGRDAVLSVRDEGIGIGAESLPHLFTRFYRGENSDNRKMGGMGLGLFIVQEIVTLHGGAVGVESVEGEGTTVRVRLPRLEPG